MQWVHGLVLRVVGKSKQPAAIVLSKLWCDTLLEALCSRGQSDLRVCEHVLTLESAGAHALPPGMGTGVEEITSEDLNISFTATSTATAPAFR
jgi:hypothetical protein